MKDLGLLEHFLGIHFRRTATEIMLSQEEYINRILNKFSMADCKPRGTPCEVNPNVYDNDGSEPYDTYLYR